MKPGGTGIDANSLLSGGLLALLLVGYVAGSYIGIVAVGSLPFAERAPSPNFQPPWWLNLIAFAVIALGFLPVSRWLRININALIYAEHDDPYALIAGVTKSLQAMVAPRATLPAVAQTIAQRLRLPYVALETTDANAPWGCAYGTAPQGTAISELNIAYLDRRVGVLRVSGRGPNQPLSTSDLTLLRDVAQQLGIALRAAQLTAEAQSARERLVLAREEERRRIRNDLHDGLAPTLSALQLQLGALCKLIRQDPVQAEALAAELGDDLRNATGAIRQLVYDLRPPMLDELKLVGALRSLRFPGSSVRFEVQAPEPMPALPAAVEVALYRVASEAMHNVIKHSGATRCTVSIEAADGRLTLTVGDDGKSLPNEFAAGVGLRSMRERAAELGGSLEIERGTPRGTRVTARIPLGTGTWTTSPF